MNKFMTFSANVQNVFNNDSNDFAAFSQLMTDYAQGTQQVSAKEANAKIVEVFQNVLGIDKNSNAKQVRQALRRNQALVFDIIEETLDNLMVTGWSNDPFFNKYVDMRNLALGQKNEFEVEDDSLLSVMRVSGGHHDIIRQRLGAGTHTSINTYTCAIKIYAEFQRVLMGVEDFAKFITKVYEAYDRYIKNTIYDAMVGYSATIPAMWKKTGSVTAANLHALCDLVSTATGYPVMIMGTRTALANVTALQNVSYIGDRQKDEFNRFGILTIWEGIPLVQIPQVFEKNQVGTYKIDNNMLWIMPDADNRFLKFVNEGDMELRAIQDKDTNMDETFEYEIMAKLGCAVIFNMGFAMYDIDDVG